MEDIITCCPYCKSKKIEYDMRLGRYRCRECGVWFDKDDCEHQLYWENISCILNGTSEENPLELKEHLILPSVEDASCGLSDSQKLNIDKVFQVEGDGTMWYHFEYNDEFPEGTDGKRVPIWNDMYELSTSDLKALLEHLRRMKK